MKNALIVNTTRENIGSLLDGNDDQKLALIGSYDELRAAFKPGQLLCGFWGRWRSSPLPDFIVVSDDKVDDTYAWLSAFLPGLAPISAWCRVISVESIARYFEVGSGPSNMTWLTGWVGAALAEASLARSQSLQLKDVSGLVAVSTSTFAAGRAVQVWGDEARLSDVASHFQRTMVMVGRAPRGPNARTLLPLWSVLANIRNDRDPDFAFEVTEPFRHILWSARLIDASKTQEAAQLVGDYFGVPEIVKCAIGPQGSRVGALDDVAKRMLSGPRSVAIDAVVGFAGSLVDPGVAVMPELLKRYRENAPYSPVWMGAFAGVWSKLRVMSDYNGLGRIVSKHLTRANDLFSKPSADIGFHELSRWLGDGSSDRVRIKGMRSSTLDVELIDGVTLPFFYATSQVRYEAVQSASQRVLDFDSRPSRIGRTEPTAERASQGTRPDAIEDVVRRLAVLEQAIADLTKKARTPSRATKKQAS